MRSVVFRPCSPPHIRFQAGELHIYMHRGTKTQLMLQWKRRDEVALNRRDISHPERSVEQKPDGIPSSCVDL